MIKVWIGLAASIALLGAGAAGGHYVAARQETGRAKTCAADIKLSKADRCWTEIQDAFNTLQLGQTTRDLTTAQEIVVVQGQSRAAELAELERLRSDLRGLAAAPVTNQCASAPSMELLREQLCREVGGEGCEP